MNRSDLIRLAVLLEISDDYEEPVHVHHNVSERLKVCGIATEPEDVHRALTDLVQSGLARAYWLGPGPEQEVHGLPPPDRFEKYYFLITDEGHRTLAIWRKEWPLDDEDELLPTWSPISDV